MWDWDEVDSRSLLGRLRSLPDPRRRQPRVYPLPGPIAMLVLAATAGESSLRGMWLWAVERWATIGDRLSIREVARPPALGTVWKVMGRIDLEKLEAVFAEWSGQELGVQEGAMAIDGKTLVHVQETFLGMVRCSS